MTQPICLGIHEVKQKEYEAVMKAIASYFASTGWGKDAVANLETQHHPVEMMSWNDELDAGLGIDGEQLFAELRARAKAAIEVVLDSNYLPCSPRLTVSQPLSTAHRV